MNDLKLVLNSKIFQEVSIWVCSVITYDVMTVVETGMEFEVRDRVGLEVRDLVMEEILGG